MSLTYKNKEKGTYKSGANFVPINVNNGFYQGTLHFVKQLSIKKFLDVGCRDGQFTAIIRETTGAHASGVEVEENAVIAAREKRIDAHVVDMECDKIPYDDSSFDCVVFVGVLEHLYDKDHCMEEIWRVLKPNGDLILATPNLSSWISRLLLLFGYQPLDTVTSIRYALGFPQKFVRWPPNDHINLCTYRAIIDLLKKYGFEIKGKRGESIFVERLLWLRPFERALYRFFPALGGGGGRLGEGYKTAEKCSW